MEGTAHGDMVAIAGADEGICPEFNPLEVERIAGHLFDEEILNWLDAIIANGLAAGLEL